MNGYAPKKWWAAAKLLLILLLAGFALPAQENRSTYRDGLRLTYGHGRILKHTRELETLEGFRTGGLGVDWMRQSQTEQGWAAGHQLPRTGFSLFYHWYEAPSLGYSLSVLAFVENDLPAHWQDFSFYYHMGLGLGYQSRVYDSLDNPLNQALSTHLNIAFDFRLGLRWRFLPQWDLQAGVSLFHYSNGASRLPNYGINLWQTQAALTYRFGESLTLPKRQPSQVLWQDEFLILVNIGQRQLPQDLSYHWTHSLQVEYNLLHNRGNRFGLGLALMNDAYLEEYEAWANIWGDGQHEVFSRLQTLTWGPYLNYEMVFDQLSFYLQQGWYLGPRQKTYETFIDYGEGPFRHSITLPNSGVFNRVGLRYRFGPHILLNLGLKTHLFEAQNLEIGVGAFF